MQQEELIYDANVQSNFLKLQRVNDVMALALGTSAGIIRLEALYGFLFYGLGLLITNTVFLVVCCEGKARTFFRTPVKDIFVNPLALNIAGFVMMWCLTYALVV